MTPMPRWPLSFGLSRCSRTGLMLWLGVGLLVLLLVWLPDRRDGRRHAAKVPAGDRQTAESRSTTSIEPPPELLRTSAQ